MEKGNMAKCKMDSQWCTKDVITPFGLAVWKQMRKLDVFEGIIKTQVGNERKTRMLQVKWLENRPLKELIQIYTICSTPTNAA